MASANIRAASTSYVPSVATSSHVINVPAGVVDGDILIMFMSAPANVSTPAITPPAGWTTLWDTAVSTAFRTYCAYRIASSEPTSYTWTTSVTTRPAAIMFAVEGSGVAPTASNFTSATSSTSFPSPSVSTTSDETLVVALNGSPNTGGTQSFTPDGAFTEFADVENTNNHACVEVGYVVKTPIGSISSTATAVVSVNRSAGLVLFPSFVDADTVRLSLTPSGTDSAGVSDTATEILALVPSSLEGYGSTDAAIAILSLVPSAVEFPAVDYVDAATARLSLIPSATETTVPYDSDLYIINNEVLRSIEEDDRWVTTDQSRWAVVRAVK